MVAIYIQKTQVWVFLNWCPEAQNIKVHIFSFVTAEHNHM